MMASVLSNPLYQQLPRQFEEEQKWLDQELKQKNDELDEARKSWKRAASALNKLQVNVGQRFYKMTDDYLIERASKLGYDIRNFTFQYLDDGLSHAVATKKTKYLDLYMHPTTPGINTYETLLRSRRRRLSVVQAFIWRVLVGEVVDQFRWLGKPQVICGVWLRPQTKTNSLSPESPSTYIISDSEAERKFQRWRATTVDLILEKMDLKEGGDAYKKLEQQKQSIADQLREIIDPFLSKKANSYEEQLLEIIARAVDLVTGVSRQAAGVS
ncbi:uncharacterized protein PAC_03611 [Phialocephala subalpina]|uniref:Uncharacterized protein n=1 Tax=Phialocephala subalpina TaxID=576137 RepID=A0A1L7WLT8_9HELO|nr:uncharacterized protein PAC_03611 [Phialocephala subalpina]